MGRDPNPAMLRNPLFAHTLYLFTVLCSLCVLANSSVVAKPAKNIVPTAKQESVPTDRSPRNKDDCLAVAQALNEQAKTLSKRTKQGVPREFARVASDLDASCGEEDFRKAWISIEWMNGCLNNFTKNVRVGILF